MEISVNEDIDAPVEQVFAALSDFESIERQALRNGLKVTRGGDVAEPGPGMCWDVTASFRGKDRELSIELTGLTPEEEMKFHSASGGLEAETVLETVSLSRGKTRISLTTVLVPKTLSARLLVQSLKLGKSGIEKRFKKRAAKMVGDLETRLKGTA